MNPYPKCDSAKIVRQALDFQRPDRLPVFDCFWPEFIERWKRENPECAESDIYEHFWNDLEVPVAAEELFPSQKGTVGRQGKAILYNDGWGRIVKRYPDANFSETIHRDFQTPEDLDELLFEPADLDSRYPPLLAKAATMRRRGMALFIKIGGVYIRSTFFRGQTEFLMDLAGDEPFAKAIAEKIGAHLLQIGLESLRRTNAYDFGVWIFDDMCSHRGPMFSPKTFERVFLPIYKNIVAELKSAGARYVFMHSDGNLTPLLDLLLEAGFDGINPVEPAAGMDAVDLLERYAGRLRLVGGMCNSHILPRGDEREVRYHTERLVEAGRDGGLIIGAHSIGPDISTKTYELFRDIVLQRGRYR